MGIWLSKPNFRAWSYRVFAPSFRPSSANVTSHDTVRARASVMVEPPGQVESAKLWNRRLVWGSESEDGLGNVDDGVYPCSRAAARSISLNVDPGG